MQIHMMLQAHTEVTCLLLSMLLRYAVLWLHASVLCTVAKLQSMYFSCSTHVYILFLGGCIYRPKSDRAMHSYFITLRFNVYFTSKYLRISTTFLSVLVYLRIYTPVLKFYLKQSRSLKKCNFIFSKVYIKSGSG